MSGKPASTSLEGRLLSGLTYSPAGTRGKVSPGGTRDTVYTSCLERPDGTRGTLYTIYSDAERHSEVCAGTTGKPRLKFKTEPVNPPEGSPTLTGHPRKWPGGGIDVYEWSWKACRRLLMHELGKRATAIKPAKAAAKPATADKVAADPAASQAETQSASKRLAAFKKRRAGVARQEIIKALDDVADAFEPDELAYLALTSKPEHLVRDRLAWALTKAGHRAYGVLSSGNVEGCGLRTFYTFAPLGPELDVLSVNLGGLVIMTS